MVDVRLIIIVWYIKPHCYYSISEFKLMVTYIFFLLIC